MDIQKKLISFAFEKAFPYIADRPEISSHRSNISFILVGSAATGLCTAESDVDICLVCDRSTFNAISAGTGWEEGRPTEIILDGTQLHYYALSTDNLEEKIRRLDDLVFYIYGNAMVIDDANGQYKRIADKIHDPSLHSQRLESALDMLGRRRLALRYVLSSDTDPMARVEICTELIKRLLMCIALYDGLEFDRRKRLYQTALLGPTGSTLKQNIDSMLSLLGYVHRSAEKAASENFLKLFDVSFQYILQNKGSRNDT